MSHIAEIKIKARDLDVLDAAAQRLGGELRRGQRTHAWYGLFVGDSPGIAGVPESEYGKCEHALHFPDARYEVGVVAARDGDGFDLRWDSWCEGGLAAVIGAGAEKLTQAYGIEAAKAEALRSGWACNEEQQPDGTVLLHINAEA